MRSDTETEAMRTLEREGSRRFRARLRGRARGQYRHGVAGEVYDRGVIEPIGPFAGTGTPRKASESFGAWVRRQIDAIDALAASAGKRP